MICVSERAEDFIKRANIKHTGKFDYTQVVYVNARTDVTIRCITHDLTFKVQPYVHLKSKFSCPKCETEHKKKKGTLLTTSEFIAKAQSKHWNKYDYSSTEYDGAVKHITVTCPLHGSFSIVASAHLRGNGGCLSCAKESKVAKQSHTTDDFIVKAKEIHKQVAYDYSLVDYKTNAKRVDIICPVHGKFSQRASKHLEGSGCPSCAITGFSTSKSGTLYIFKHDNITKVGITNSSVSDRLNSVSRSSGLQFKIVKQYQFASGQSCTDVETELLRSLRESYKSPTTKFDGYTECFYDVDISVLTDKIEGLRKQYEK